VPEAERIEAGIFSLPTKSESKESIGKSTPTKHRRRQSEVGNRKSSLVNAVDATHDKEKARVGEGHVTPRKERVSSVNEISSAAVGAGTESEGPHSHRETTKTRPRRGSDAQTTADFVVSATKRKSGEFADFAQRLTKGNHHSKTNPDLSQAISAATGEVVTVSANILTQILEAVTLLKKQVSHLEEELAKLKRSRSIQNSHIRLVEFSDIQVHSNLSFPFLSFPFLSFPFLSFPPLPLTSQLHCLPLLVDFGVYCRGRFWSQDLCSMC